MASRTIQFKSDNLGVDVTLELSGIALPSKKNTPPTYVENSGWTQTITLNAAGESCEEVTWHDLYEPYFLVQQEGNSGKHIMRLKLGQKVTIYKKSDSNNLAISPPVTSDQAELVWAKNQSDGIECISSSREYRYHAVAHRDVKNGHSFKASITPSICAIVKFVHDPDESEGIHKPCVHWASEPIWKSSFLDITDGMTTVRVKKDTSKPVGFSAEEFIERRDSHKGTPSPSDGKKASKDMIDHTPPLDDDGHRSDDSGRSSDDLGDIE
ncbi:hypothetical protein C2E23DRAFT_885620 [Lenzites betulinus]|nr:hypothetical protein C2E23DRAFT_885620 [Lenzites betulinus]